TDRRHACVGVLALLALERLHVDAKTLTGDVQPDLVWVLGDVDEPVRVRLSAAVRCDQEPRRLAVRKNAEHLLALMARLCANRGQNPRLEAHELPPLGRLWIFVASQLPVDEGLRQDPEQRAARHPGAAG